jgi:hypothetical protein
MARGRLRESRALVAAHAYLSSPRGEDEAPIDLERFIEFGDLGEPVVILKYDPEFIKQIAESGKFGA